MPSGPEPAALEALVGAGMTDVDAAIGACGAAVRLLSHSSRKEPLPVGAGAADILVGACQGLGDAAVPVAPPNGELKALAAGLTFGSGFTVIRSNISFSTVDCGRPYLAAESCLSASDKRGFGVPKAGKVAMLNGCVGTPPISVRTIVL